jgi:hypothetical protein
MAAGDVFVRIHVRYAPAGLPVPKITSGSRSTARAPLGPTSLAGIGDYKERAMGGQKEGEISYTFVFYDF